MAARGVSALLRWEPYAPGRGHPGAYPTQNAFQVGALIKLSGVASKLTTLSAQDMIKAMIAGQRDPEVLAALARCTMKAKHDALVEALDGMFKPTHWTAIDCHYETLRIGMQDLFHDLGVTPAPVAAA